MRLILLYIAPFLCSLLWFYFKSSGAHGAKPPDVGLSSCLPALCCKGRVCTCPNPMQREGSAGIRELKMLQSVLTWKNRLKPTTEGTPEPTQHSGALLLSVQCIFATCSISLSYFSSALLDCEASLTWKAAVRDDSNPHSATLHAVGSWKGKAAWGGNFLTGISPRSIAIHALLTTREADIV